jgi:hypothetical protein
VAIQRVRREFIDTEHLFTFYLHALERELYTVTPAAFGLLLGTMS